VLGFATGREAANHLMTFVESEDGRVGLGEPGAWRDFEPAFAAGKFVSTGLKGIQAGVAEAAMEDLSLIQSPSPRDA
jgi:hypothetical protein